MSRIAVLAALAFALIGPARLRAQEIPLPTEWSTHYAWFLVGNPEYQTGSNDSESALTAAHIQYQLRLQKEGHAIAAGALGPGGDEAVRGLTILRAKSLEEARAVARADPAVRAGRLLARVREWWVPAESLP